MYYINESKLYIESKVHHCWFTGWKWQFLLFGHVAINNKHCWLCVQNSWTPKVSNSAFDWHNGVQQDLSWTKYQIISYSWFNTVKNTTNLKTAILNILLIFEVIHKCQAVSFLISLQACQRWVISWFALWELIAVLGWTFAITRSV